jgi:hypothetical protein
MAYIDPAMLAITMANMNQRMIGDSRGCLSFIANLWSITQFDLGNFVLVPKCTDKF